MGTGARGVARQARGLPTGTVTFLFTDIEGSTRLWTQYPDSMRFALARHDVLIEHVIQTHGGAVFKTVGDQFCAAFLTAADALHAALAAQRALQAEHWGETGPLKVRIALHTGTVAPRDGDYIGPPLSRAARLVAAGHGGQVLLSLATQELVCDHLPEGASLRDLGRHRLKDLIRPERIFQCVTPDLPSDFPSLRSLDAFPNNMPVQVTSFIGREREMEEVRRLLAGTRLLTLTGPGGTGKTRLSLQVAADLLDDLPDGVWLVELATLTDPAYVPQAVAAALGVREEPGSPLALTLAYHLQFRRLLLLLDNCEHLVVACAELVDLLLRNCPHLRLLATSREALGIAGETTLLVPSLSVPNPKEWSRGEGQGSRVEGQGSRVEGVQRPIGHRPSTLDPRPLTLDPQPSALLQYDAVRLFVERAAAASPSFRLTGQNAAAVAQICHRLDGIPLAIELAAARVRALAAEQIAARLDDRFRLLTGGSRTALPRQQTLRALIDWSHDLLSGAERVLLRRLSVFASGWTLEAAEAVCSGVQVFGCSGVQESVTDPADLNTRTPEHLNTLSSKDVLDLLTQLVNKSLVLVEDRQEEVRYRLLDTIRQYARDKLLEGGEAAVLRQCHWEWFVALAEQAEPELHGPDQAAWLERLETEHDNLRAALEWSVDGDLEAAHRLAAALWRFWLMRAHLSEGRGWLERIAACGECPTPHFATVLHGAGALACQQEDLAAAGPLLDRSVTLWRALGDPREVAASLVWMGRVPLGQGDHAAARALFEESLRIFREVGDQRGIARSLNNLGEVDRDQGNYEQAGKGYAESLALGRETEHQGIIAISLHNLAQVALRRGDYGQAADLFRESLSLFHELGDKRAIGACLAGLAAVAVATVALSAPQGGEGFRGAARLLGAARALLEAVGSPLPPTDRTAYERCVTAVRAGLDEERFAAAWREGQAMTLEQAIEEAVRQA